MQRFVILILVLCLLPFASLAVNSQDSPMVGEQQGYAYDQATFSNQREILDFIKTLDFDKKPPLKKLSEFYNTENIIPDSKVLRKGVELYQKGKVINALDYFSNVYMDKNSTSFEKDYASWQLAHYIYFGVMDVFYNGMPSRMDRTNMIGDFSYKPKVSLSLGVSYYSIIANPKLISYNPRLMILTLARSDFDDSLSKFFCSNPTFTKEFLAAALYEAFPKNKELNIAVFTEPDDLIYGTKPLKYAINEKSSIKSRAANFIETITEFFNIMD
ncbi:MAG: hypothetical protein K2F79_05725, partial [Muribaculaceae bacterium]|nr:hypothetical protein [Muribaculaceae bacterium]